MKKILNIFSLLFLFLLITSLVYARQGGQGCCSYHKGIDYCDTFVGRYVCNDGEYSPTCRCTYIPPIPTPLPLDIPKGASWNFNISSEDTCKYDLVFIWDKQFILIDSVLLSQKLRELIQAHQLILPLIVLILKILLREGGMLI